MVIWYLKFYPTSLLIYKTLTLYYPLIKAVALFTTFHKQQLLCPRHMHASFQQVLAGDLLHMLHTTYSVRNS